MLEGENLTENLQWVLHHIRPGEGRSTCLALDCLWPQNHKPNPNPRDPSSRGSQRQQSRVGANEIPAFCLRACSMHLRASPASAAKNELIWHLHHWRLAGGVHRHVRYGSIPAPDASPASKTSSIRCSDLPRLSVSPTWQTVCQPNKPLEAYSASLPSVMQSSCRVNTCICRYAETLPWVLSAIQIQCRP